jgi:hypothetical protein
MSWISSFFNWLGSFVKSGPDPAKITAIQAAVVKACGFLPMAESVAAMLSAGNPAVVTVSAIANQICVIVKNAPTPVAPLTLAGVSGQAATMTQWGTVNGVPVQGVFVR